MDSLKLNEDKTQVIWQGTHQQLAQCIYAGTAEQPIPADTINFSSLSTFKKSFMTVDLLSLALQ